MCWGSASAGTPSSAAGACAGSQVRSARACVFRFTHTRRMRAGGLRCGVRACVFRFTYIRHMYAGSRARNARVFCIAQVRRSPGVSGVGGHASRSKPVGHMCAGCQTGSARFALHDADTCVGCQAGSAHPAAHKLRVAPTRKHNPRVNLDADAQSLRRERLARPDVSGTLFLDPGSDLRATSVGCRREFEA